mmetsp:Transcript_120992/g.210475  ORF Transcript_120992/g.210475 Transcript_120992/m.210475 type:complete len:256 (+) Transcript_120992:2026-2793(+)
MNVLKRIVPWTIPPKHWPSSVISPMVSTPSTQGPTSKMSWPKFMMISRTMSWNVECPSTKVHMRLEIKGAARLIGPLPLKRASSEGHSVARARAARVSMIRFSHSSWTGLRGSSFSADRADPTTVSSTPATLTVNWNCRNFRMLSFTVRPHTAALTTVAKLSSMSTISAAPVATSVPLFMANPTSDSFRAGASFVPSPVTATMSPRFIRQATSTSLSVGLLRARTRSLGSSDLSFSGSSYANRRKSAPSMTVPSS